MKIFISALEASSDSHAAELVRAFQKKYPDKKSEFFGSGGEALRSAGCRVDVDLKELSVMGFSEVLSKFFKIIKAFYFILKLIQKNKPDLVIVLDYPGFHMKLIQRVYQKLGIPVIYYIPPKIWAWKKKRLYSLKKYCDLILSILPFEEPLYKEAGIPFKYCGNPLLDQLPLSLTTDEAREKLCLNKKDNIVCVLFGSRNQEFLSHYQTITEALFLSLESLSKDNTFLKDSPLKVLCPISPNLDIDFLERVFYENLNKKFSQHPCFSKIQFIFLRGQSHLCMKAADFGLIKSGTSTLEAGLLGCPHVLFYKVSKISEWIFKVFIRYKKPVGLVNLVLGVQSREQSPFRELLGSEGFSAERLSFEILDLFTNTKRKEFLKQESQRLHQLLITDKSPSERAAESVYEFIEKRKKRMPLVHEKNILKLFFYILINTIWSNINFFRRLFLGWGLCASKKINPKVVSIGNIQAGGTGKTPFVISYARFLLSQGKNIVILTRGYKSQAEKKGLILSPKTPLCSVQECGDEARMIQEALPEAWIGVGQNRLQVFYEIEKQSQKNIDIVILDDGFQNIKIKKDMEVVLLTSLQFYQGFFRDYPSALSPSCHVFWTKGNSRPEVPLGVQLQEIDYKVSIFKGSLSGITQVDIVSAVADNNSIQKYIESKKIVIQNHYKFSDHYSYKDKKFSALIQKKIENGKKIVTTKKDWVKLSPLMGGVHVREFEKSFIVLDLEVKCDYSNLII